MALLLNGAGGTDADPIIEDLPLTLLGGANTLDLSANIRAFIDTAAGAGTNEVTAGLSPDPTTVFTAGTNGSWALATKTFTLTSNAGLAVGNYLYVDNGVTAVLAQIATIPAGTTTVTFTEAVFAADATNVSYQVHYSYNSAFNDVGALKATALGQVNYWKFQGSDANGNVGSASDLLYGRLDPAGSAFIEINGGAFTGQTITTFTPTFSVLSAWANRGGILTLELVSSSGMTWWDGTTGEKTMSAIYAQAAGSRLVLTGTDGLKTATLRMRSRTASPNFRDVPISVTVDSSAPNILINIRGR